MVMEWKEDDARKQGVTEERKMAYKWRAGEEVAILNEYKITRRFKDLAKKESESELRNQREKKDKKIRFLAHKNNECERN